MELNSTCDPYTKRASLGQLAKCEWGLGLDDKYWNDAQFLMVTVLWLCRKLSLFLENTH